MPPNQTASNGQANTPQIPGEKSPNKHNYGLSTAVAIGRLHDDIERILLEYEQKFKAESWYGKIIGTFVEPDESPLGWFASATTIMTAISLVIAHAYTAAICLMAILLLSLFLVIREHKLRRTEIYRKTRHALAELRLAEQQLCTDWQTNNYPHTCCPMSPCVSLQWTYRDGVIVNLPWALLVHGDHIVLRPGHLTPGPCTEVGGRKSFNANEIYGVSQMSDPPVKPVARAPLPDLVCCLQNTPFLDNLRMILENNLQRPPTIYNQQRYLLVTKYIQQWGFILVLSLTALIGILRMHGIVISSVANEHANHEHWKHIMLEAATAVLPLLPLIFPLLWISMDLWGMARLKCFLNTSQSVLERDGVVKSYEEDLDTPTYNFDNISLMRSNVFRNWLALWQGDSELLPRTSNVVQVLGSITALCCVDKKGILSWPNPTAEKVFFLHDKDDEHLDNGSSSQSTNDDTDSDEPAVDHIKSMGVVAEVLDLTHDQHCPFRLEFDDTEWKNHIKSLKPLGLAILLNTCSPATHAHYAQFCGHVTAVAMLDKDLVPVTNRRCLCELAKQIGFTDHATDRFNVEGQLAIYRHLQPDVVRRDIRFARQFQLTSKVKVPFPHSLSVVMRENPGGYLSLFTQGTADIILDCCDDFWDGKDLHALSQQDRKRALDFYQRSALTAYCTAFAYRPLRHGIHGALSGGSQAPQGPIAYLELPPESKIRMQHVDKMHCDFEVTQGKLSHSMSSDSLLYSDANKEEDISNVDGCYEMQCHQVFIGMVTMQYQAQTDIVQLVEQLERACIRFVHFSKENELRSRVFSEKMGLESGWNCHISLLSEVEEKTMMNTGACGGTTQSPKSSGGCEDEDSDLNCLLPPANLESSKSLSCSAPGAISNQTYDVLPQRRSESEQGSSTREQLSANASPLGSQVGMASTEHHHHHPHQSHDSAMEDEGHCRSLSNLTESSEQSAPVHFDMSNRAKLPRGIENIRPHLEQVDNVPLQVSLFTDCSAEATRQMLEIMQSYGEIVVCLGSSASNANSKIFLQADCSIAVEPLYPQVCQDIPAYTEANIRNNKLRCRQQNQKNSATIGADGTATEELLECGLYGGVMSRAMLPPANTVSPISLSRLLNSLPCSISVHREDPLSLVAIIELSRRFSTGLWNCIQYWACCASTLSAITLLCTCLSLPPLLTPLMVLYLMSLPVPLIALSLAHIEVDPKTMNRATGKKQTEYNTGVFGFVLWCYGCKFIAPVIIMILFYCAFMAHPVEIFDVDEDNLHINLHIGRHFAFFGIILHFVIISASFVHRDHSLWQRNPLRNYIWTFTCFCLLLLHGVICSVQVFHEYEVRSSLDELWPAILFLYMGCFLSLLATEITKWQEIKVNTRYQRRARLDFGTKLGMNSPF